MFEHIIAVSEKGSKSISSRHDEELACIRIYHHLTALAREYHYGSGAGTLFSYIDICLADLHDLCRIGNGCHTIKTRVA